jgi:hypothetical protein
MRRSQNETALLRQELKQAADHKQPVETKDETQMATKKSEGWEKGEGVYSRSKLPMTRDRPWELRQSEGQAD